MFGHKVPAFSFGRLEQDDVTTPTPYDAAFAINPRLLGRTLAYSAGVAYALESIPAAILWHHLSWATTPNARGWCEVQPDAGGWFAYNLEDLADHLVFGTAQLRGARDRLEVMGLVLTERRGLPARLFWRLLDEGFAAMMRKQVLRKAQNTGAEIEEHRPAKIAEHSFIQSDSDKALRAPLAPAKAPRATKAKQAPLLPQATVTVEQVLRGDHDKASLMLAGPKAAHAHAICDCLLAEWARLWGKTRVTLTPERRRMWQRWISEQKTASEILKAIVGMTHDDGPADRSIHNDWPLVARNFDVWVGLYQKRAAVGAKPVWPKTSASSVPGCRLWKGVWIPVDHTPDQLDEERVAEGKQVFIIDDRTWADPAWDPSARIAQQVAKYGSTINQPVRRAP